MVCGQPKPHERNIMISRSNIDGNGRETMTLCIKCSLDNRNICNGTKITLVNNHSNNSFLIFKSITGDPFFEELHREKGSTYELSEFKKWLDKNNYTEDNNLACERIKNN